MRLFSPRFCDCASLSSFSVNCFFGLFNTLVVSAYSNRSRSMFSLAFLDTLARFAYSRLPFSPPDREILQIPLRFRDFQFSTYRFTMGIWQSPFRFAQHSRSFCSSIFTFVITLVVSACPFLELFNTLVQFRMQFYRIFKNIWFFNRIDPSVYPPLSRAEISNL